MSEVTVTLRPDTTMTHLFLGMPHIRGKYPYSRSYDVPAFRIQEKRSREDSGNGEVPGAFYSGRF